MPITFDKRNQRWRYHFDRIITGTRQRASRLLPKGWTRAQADTYDRTETARLYAVATGVERPVRLIDDAVLVYLEERGPQLKNRANLEVQLEACFAWFTGRPITDLPAVAREYALDQTGTLAPATIRNRIAYLRAACRYAWKVHAYCEHDPAARLVVPRVNNARKVYLDRAEMLTIARAIQHRQARAAVRVGFYSGMRQAEICRAQVKNGLFVLANTKNGEPRVVPVHPKLGSIVRSSTVWPIMITTWTVSHQFTAAARAVGLGHATFHTLRHSTASAWAI